MSYGVCVVRQAPVICVMVPPIHLGAWSMALMLWLPFELLYLLPHTAHLEMFPAIEYRMNGLLFSAIGGCCCCDNGGAAHIWVP